MDVAIFTVCDVRTDSRSGVASVSKPFYRHCDALDALRDRLYDDYADAAADVGGPLWDEFAAAMGEVERCRATDGDCPDVSWNGTRYWVAEEHEESV